MNKDITRYLNDHLAGATAAIPLIQTDAKNHNPIMSTKSKYQATNEKSGNDKAAFKHLPKKTRNLMMLKEQQEKSTGSEQFEIAQEIEDNA